MMLPLIGDVLWIELLPRLMHWLTAFRPSIASAEVLKLRAAVIEIKDRRTNFVEASL